MFVRYSGHLPFYPQAMIVFRLREVLGARIAKIIFIQQLLLHFVVMKKHKLIFYGDNFVLQELRMYKGVSLYTREIR